MHPDVTTLLQFAREAIVVWDLNGTITAWNRAAERLYGYTAGEIVGQSIAKLMPADGADDWSVILERIRRGDSIEDLPAVRTAKGGRVIDVLLNLVPLRDDMHRVFAVLCMALDLSERKSLERAERDQSFLAALLTSANDAVIGRDLNGIVTTWSRGAEWLFGYTAAEMLGQSMACLVPPGQAGEDSELLERVRRGESIEHYDTRRIRKDGKPIDVSFVIAPVQARLGRIIGSSTIAHDVGYRSRLEQAERDRLFLGSIVSSADDAIISKNLNGIVTSWNRAAQEIFGYTAEEMIGQSITKIIPPEQMNEEPLILERIRRGERVDHYESRRRRKDGRIIDVSLTISPIKDHLGQVTGASKIVRDITERRRWREAEIAQSFLGALVESADDAIISKDLDGIVTSWNPAAERLYGYTAAEMIGKPIGLLIPAEHPDEEPQILERIRRGERIEHYETTRVRKDGRVIDVSITVSPIRDGLGRIFGASKIARDITERKRAQNREREVLKQAEESRLQAERALAEAEQANRTKDEFLATISHELRTPLTSILGWTRMLVNGHVGPERHSHVFEIIDRNARSQAQLVEDLLDISRIISGKLRVEFRSVDMPGLVHAAIEAVRPSAEAKNIRIDSIFSSGGGPITGDADRLQQVVWNLLSNAIKFTPNGGCVQVELRRVESQLELRVTDNGIGIGAEFLPNVFNRFSQADASTTRSRGGLGMGLAIVKSLVELHGGVVFASSPGHGEGSVFTVKLPISAAHRHATRGPVERPALHSEVMQSSELVGLRILIVDDERDTLEMLRFIFDECGSIVETAQSAEAALALYDVWHPDILISDIGMPGMDGYDLIRVVRGERGSRIPAVALTAMSRINDRLKALTAGYQMHVSKPIEPIELITIVSSLVGLVNRRPGQDSGEIRGQSH